MRLTNAGATCTMAMLLALGMGGLPRTAEAHPHVWVSVETTVVYDKGTISGLRHRWSFDELYTTMAVQGLDTNNDGAYDRKELSELAQVNMDGLKEFEYFTQAKLGTQALATDAPNDYWLEYKDGVLSLNFVLPLKQPVLAEADGFSFAVSDPSYFIAFDLAKDQPIRLSEGAPAGCQANIVTAEQDKAELERLGKAFQQELGGASLGIGVAKSVAVSCPKS